MKFRSGGLISAVDEFTCDDEARVAQKTRPDNQRLGVAVLVPTETVRRHNLDPDYGCLPSRRSWCSRALQRPSQIRSSHATQATIGVAASNFSYSNRMHPFSYATGLS